MTRKNTCSIKTICSSQNQETPLMWAARNGGCRTIKTLIKLGARLDEWNNVCTGYDWTDEHALLMVLHQFIQFYNVAVRKAIVAVPDHQRLTSLLALTARGNCIANRSARRPQKGCCSAARAWGKNLHSRLGMCRPTT